LCWLGLVCCSALGATGSAATTPPSAEEVLRQALKARGGPEALAKIQSFQAKGTVSFLTGRGPWWGATSVTNVWPLQILATHSNQFRCSTDLSATADASSAFVPPRYYEHGCDGQKAWEVPPGRPPQVLEGIFGEERREQAQCFAWCAEPQHYRSLTNLGQTMFQGRRCYELKLVRPSGNEETHYYDVANHLLTAVVRSSVFGPSLEMFVLSDYRSCGGFLFPTRIAYSAEDERSMANLKAVEELAAWQVNCVRETDLARPQTSARRERPTHAQSGGFRATELQDQLQEWVTGDKLAGSIVVGYLDEQGRSVASSGQMKHDGLFLASSRVNGDTTYPLCSISKVFTRLLLLDMVQRGELRLDDPAQPYLPAALHLPVRHGMPITLLHLATHTSALPRHLDGSEAEIYAQLSEYKLPRDPGAAFEYSNLGMRLLGKAIERKAGQPFQQLVRDRICRPLGLKHTRVMDSVFPGADGVLASANDLLTFAAACLGLRPAPAALAPLLAHEFATHGGGDGAGLVLELIQDPVRQRAVVILAHGATSRYMPAHAALQHLILNPVLTPPAASPHYRPLEAASLGQYLFDNDSVWSLRPAGKRLLLQETGQASYELFPVAAGQFTNRLLGLEATLVPGSAGQPGRLVLWNPEQHRRLQGTRMASPTPQSERTDDCAGQYQGPEGRTLVIRRAGNQFFAEFNGPNAAEQDVQCLVAEAPGSFHCQTAPAALTCLRDPAGPVTAAILHCYDRHTRYAKVAPAPTVAASDTDNFLGTWETNFQNGQTTVHASLEISKRQGAYRATFTAKEFKNYPFETLVFLSDTSLFLGTSFGEHPASFKATLNAAATELSGTWKEGQTALTLTLTRADGTAPEKRKPSANEKTSGGS
jgi:hypothetical protein